MKLYISADRPSAPAAAIRTSPQGPILFFGRTAGTVAEAIREVANVFGPLHWNEANKATVDLERRTQPARP
jgi:hypothetical protein